MGVALGAVTWARGLLQDPALAWDMTQYLQGQNCCHVLLLAGTFLAAAAQAASLLHPLLGQLQRLILAPPKLQGLRISFSI